MEKNPHVASPFLSGSTENRCGLPVFPMVVSDVNCQELRDR
ncbi:replication domain protein [Escherichia coli 3-267-03_S4_C1]|nr:replication domain protein [Escherichia coli 3-267-03_S4_C1]